MCRCARKRYVLPPGIYRPSSIRSMYSPHPAGITPELRVFAVNGRDELSINGPIDESNVIAACERIDERIKNKSRPYQDPLLNLSDRSLDPLIIGRLMKCVMDNQVRLKVLWLDGNRLDDFDLEFCIGSYIESVSARFLSELNLSQNLIGDYGCICVLQFLVNAKLASTDSRITVVNVRNNLITHPNRVIEAIPPHLRQLVYAAGISDPRDIDSARIHMVGLDDQRCPRAKRDGAALVVSASRESARSVIREPDDDDQRRW